MDGIYENADFFRPSINKHSFCKDNLKVQQDKEVPQSSRRTVLLTALCVFVVLAVGGLCVLGVLYHLKRADYESVRVQHDVVSSELLSQRINSTNFEEKFKELTNQHEETLRKLNGLHRTTGCALCAQNWIHFKGKCYHFSNLSMNWTRCRDHCVTLGGHLVIINSKAEQDFVTSKVNVHHWIGLSDLDIEGQWVWVNNQPLNNSIEFWMAREGGIKEPDNWTKHFPGGEDCASLGHSAGETDFWTDGYCFHEKKFVCEALASV